MWIEYKNQYGTVVRKRLHAVVHKSIRIDKETYEFIEKLPGRSFSEKVRLLADIFRSNYKPLSEYISGEKK